MADNLVSQPPLTIPVLNQDGLLHRAWSVWFRDLYQRTAYKGGNSIDDNAKAIKEIEGNLDELTVRVEENEEDIASLTIRVGKNEEDIETLTIRVTQNEQDILSLFSKVEALEYRVYEIVNTTVSVTASEYQTIICKNTNDINVTLKTDPVIGDEINIKRSGGVVNVIGQIDGLTDMVLNVPRYSMKLVFNGTDWSEI